MRGRHAYDLTRRGSLEREMTPNTLHVTGIRAQLHETRGRRMVIVVYTTNAGEIRIALYPENLNARSEEALQMIRANRRLSPTIIRDPVALVAAIETGGAPKEIVVRSTVRNGKTLYTLVKERL